MIKTTIPDIDVNELIKDIQAQASALVPQQPIPSQKVTALQEKKSPALDPINQQPRIHNDMEYRVEDFLRFHEIDFIYNAYLGIIKRIPDAYGRNRYLQRLQDGRFTKIEILGRIRFSAEGRAKGTRIRGLLIPFILHSSFKIPVVGPLLNLGVRLCTVPSTVRRLQLLEGRSAIETVRLRTRIEQLEQLCAQLTANQTIKADKTYVDQLIATRATGVELDLLRDTKADLQTVHALANSKANRIELTQTNRRISTHESMHWLITAPASKNDESTDDQLSLCPTDQLLDAYYIAFEDCFRGSEESIEERLHIYIYIYISIDSTTSKH